MKSPDAKYRIQYSTKSGLEIISGGFRMCAGFRRIFQHGPIPIICERSSSRLSKPLGTAKRTYNEIRPVRRHQDRDREFFLAHYLKVSRRASDGRRSALSTRFLELFDRDRS